ncbi:glycosyltransferase [Microbacterium sp. SORGH_AS_0888]|uniref:glycosyltransferase n=1 Tax=Microbacterium sp. SORGH_AS_0888 TaxID=3041791 RepID=UPI002784C234|nr:nucleotide disphospho-sugar-binding domain-containing protein [Microbacterium sp. SORGH_AS_0888]MDQ1129489.1 MGT family glycosyltransferase [Microbacterium sp. SORGH_AS_0888]
MATYLLASSPIHGHVGPVLQVAAALRERGHAVTMLTGTRFREQVESRDVRFAPLTGRADFDDRDPDSAIPDREKHSGIRRAQYEIRTLFIETVPDQFRALRALVDGLAPDAVLVDNAFGGAIALTRSARPRPAVAALGVMPLSQVDTGIAPHGMGLPFARGPLDRLRYRGMSFVAGAILFRELQRAAEARYGETGFTLDFPVMEIPREYDVYFQCGPRGLDYPRRHLSPNVRYIGVIPQDASAGERPAWWDDLEGSRPIVHVTQGTIDNLDFGRLVRPTLAALADEPVLVVASAGGRPVSEIGPLPANARAASYLRYDELLPLTSVFVTNAGFGGVQAALAHGVPQVLAGVTEDKPEVTTRVAWAGAGVDLRTGTPSPDAVRAAVRRVLAEPSFRAAAERLRAEIDTHDAVDEIERGLADATAVTGGSSRGF